jgi:hypothetical protein
MKSKNTTIKEEHICEICGENHSHETLSAAVSCFGCVCQGCYEPCSYCSVEAKDKNCHARSGCPLS